MVSALIIGGIALAMTAGAVSYNATDGWGLGNATESSDQVKAKTDLERKQQLIGNRPSLDRGDKTYAEYNTFGLPSIKDLQLPSIGKLTTPSITPILPPSAPGKIWAEVSIPKSELNGTGANAFVNRNDTQEINSPLDVISSSIDAALRGRYTGEYSAIWGGGIRNWWDFFNPIKFYESLYNFTVGAIDTAVWDINGDGQDSYFKNMVTDPWLALSRGEATFDQVMLGQLLINPLTTLGETLDVLSNPVKGIANNGYKGFLDSLGLGNTILSGKANDEAWNRQNYDWNIQTGLPVTDFIANLGAEILSDPLTVMELGTAVIGKIASKTAVKTTKEVVEEATEQIIKDIGKTVSKTAEEFGEEAITVALRQTGKKISVEAAEASAKRSSSELVKYTTKVLQVNMDNIINQTSETLVKSIAKHGVNNAEQLSKIVTRDMQSIVKSILVKNGINPSSKLAREVTENISKAFIKKLPYDVMTKQILATLSGKMYATHKIINDFDDVLTKSAFRVNLPALKLGGLSITALSKIPVVGTVPAKYFKDVSSALARGTNGIIESILAPITNRQAWKLAKEIQAQFGKNMLDETVYKATKDMFKTTTKIFDDISSETVKVNKKKMIRANLMSVQTTETAFTRQQYLRFSEDASVYEYYVDYYKKDIPTIRDNWLRYIKHKYPGINSAEQYITQLRKISQIEEGAFDTIASRIALMDSYVYYSTAFNMVKPGSEGLHKATRTTPNLSKVDIKNLAKANGFEVIKETTGFKIIDVEYGVLTSNNYYEQESLMDSFKGLIDKLLDNEDAEDEFLTHLTYNDRKVYYRIKQNYFNSKIQKQFLDNLAISGLSIGDPKIDKELSRALTDIFLGLKGKIVGVDDIDQILEIWLNGTEEALRNYAHINYKPNLKTENIIVSLKAQLMVYTDALGIDTPVVTLMKSNIPDMESMCNILNTKYMRLPSDHTLNTLNKWNETLVKVKDSVKRISDDIVIIPNRLNSELGTSAINNMPGNLQRVTNEGAYANTLTPILKLHNAAQFFSKVDGSKSFDFHTVHTVQVLADRAVNILNKLDSDIDDFINPATKVAIDSVFNEFIITLGNKHNIFGNEELQTILSTVLSESTTKKYALLKGILTESNRGDVTLNDLKHILNNMLEIPAYKEADIALANIKYYSKQQVTIETGINAFKGMQIKMQDNVGGAVNSINELNSIGKTTLNSNESLRHRIELQSNSSELLADYTSQLNSVKKVFEQVVEPYKKVIKDTVLGDRVTRNLDTMHTGVGLGYFSEDDAKTLKNIYDGVDNTPEALVSLQRKVYDYNKRAIDTSKYKKTINSVNKSYAQYSFMEKLSEEELLDIWTKAEWDEFDIQRFKQYTRYIQDKELPVPNAVRNVLVTDLNNTGLFKIKLDTTISAAGYSENTTGAIYLGKNIKSMDTYLYAAEHEFLHSTLSRMGASERKQIINTTFDHLMKSKHSDFIKDYYTSIYFRYYHGGINCYDSMQNVPFSFDNIDIREEVLAELVHATNEKGLHHLNLKKKADTDSVKKQLQDYHKGFIPSTAFPTGMQDYIKGMKDTVLESDKDLEALINYYYLDNIKKVAQRSPDATAVMPTVIGGKELNIGSPFEYTEEVVKRYKHAERSRTQAIIRHRLSMTAEDMAEDLARSGPFAFYSMSTLQHMQDKSGAWKWFDYNFNLRPYTKETLAKSGIIIKVIPEMDTVAFILKKKRVSYINSRALLDGRPVKPVQDFTYKVKYTIPVKGELMTFTANLQDYQDVLHSLRGQSMGYSKGFKVSNEFYTKLFKGVGQDTVDASFPVWKGIEAMDKEWGDWSLEELILPQYYTSYRFEEMIMGDSMYTRRFGVYTSDNPIINAANAIQQFSQVNKARVELGMNLFDETFSISRGIYKEYSDETLFNLLQEHPEYRLMVQVPKKGGVGVTEVIPYNIEQVKRARDLGAVLVPDSWYKRAYNTLNHRIGSEGALKAWQNVLYLWKALALMNPMTFLRNWFDTDLKTIIETKDEYLIYQYRSVTLLHEYNSILQELGDNVYSSKAIREYFENGSSKALAKAKYMDYDLFQEIRQFDIWGPSGGLAKYMEPTTDQLSRQLAAKYMDGYKTWWERITDFNGKIFDLASVTIGFNAEKRDRLAMFLKALDDGKSVEQGYQWVTKTHFDYTFRSKSDQILELMFPFITFTQKNLEYFLRLFEEQPHILKYFVEYQSSIWNEHDYTPEQIQASQALQDQLVSGNIPLFDGKDGRDYYFKLNPSFMDAFKTFVNPIGVLKDRIFLPMSAIEKATTTNYKGENRFTSQSTSQQVFDLGKQVPGMGLISQVYNSINTSTPYPVNTAVGSYKKPPVAGYSKDNYLKVVQWIPKGYNNYYNKNVLKIKSYKQQQYLWNKFNFNANQFNMYRNARISPLGNRILDPYKASGRRLMNNLYIKPNTTKRTSINKKVQRTTMIKKYAVNRAAFPRY